MSSTRVRLQAFAEARLLAEPYFADIAIILQRKGVTEQELKQLVSARTARGGKVGACVLVLIPGADVIDVNVPGPCLSLVQSFVVLVHPTINASDIGTGKEPEDIAERVLQLFHHANLGWGAVLTGGAGAIVPNDSFDGLVGQQVNLNTRGGPAALEKVGRPTISPASGAPGQSITLACGTSGAAIYYTTDGSYPSSANTAAQLYSAPFVGAAGELLVAAEKAGSVQSDINRAFFA